MKRGTIICFFILLNFDLDVQAQQFATDMDFTGSMFTSGANFYQIDSSANMYYQNIADTAEGGGGAHFRTWEWFWSDRVNSPGLPPGSFQYAFDAMHVLAQQPVCNSSGNIPAEWQFLGPKSLSLNMGIIIRVTADPNNQNILYTGSNSGGLWKADLSTSPIIWHNLTDVTGLPGLGIQDIAVDPGNSDRIYVATGYTSAKGSGYGIGILRTEDGGAHWTLIGPNSPGPDNVARKIVVDPVNPAIIYAAVVDKLYKSADHGNNWNEQFQLPPSLGDNPYAPGSIARQLVNIAILPSDHNVIFISTNDPLAAIIEGTCNSITPDNTDDGNMGSLLYRSTDGGQHWYKIFLEPDNNIDKNMAEWIALESSQQSPDVIFAAYTKNIVDNNCNIVSKQNAIVKIDKYANISDKKFPTGNFTMSTYYHAFEVAPDDANIMYASNTIRAATYGRGIWVSHLACSSANDITLSGDITSGCYEAQNDVNITAHTTNTANSGNITLMAGNEIIISASPGKEVTISPNSHLFIHPCDQPGNSFRKGIPFYSNGSTADRLTSEFYKQTGNDTMHFSNKFSEPRIYPNPAYDNFIIAFSEAKNTKDNSLNLPLMTLSDITGRMVLSQVLNRRKQRINIKNLAGGMYLIRIRKTKYIYTQKLVVQ